jgi:hypothetical protein
MLLGAAHLSIMLARLILGALVSFVKFVQQLGNAIAQTSEVGPMDFTGRTQLILIASVARRYYLEGKSKIEIAEELV